MGKRTERTRGFPETFWCCRQKRPPPVMERLTNLQQTQRIRSFNTNHLGTRHSKGVDARQPWELNSNDAASSLHAVSRDSLVEPGSRGSGNCSQLRLVPHSTSHDLKIPKSYEEAMRFNFVEDWKEDMDKESYRAYASTTW